MRQEKRNRRRLMPLLILTMLLSILFGMNAMAASKTVNMKKNSSGIYVHKQVNGYKGTIYHKITVPATGILVIGGNKVYSWGTGSMNVALCNSKKKELAKSYVDSANDRTIYCGINKGTYYLKSSGNASYALAVQALKVADKGGASKSKAYTISQKKKITGVLPIGENQNKADWFKIKVPKNKKLYFDVTTLCSGNIRLQVYGPSIRGVTSITLGSNADGTCFIRNSMTGKPMKLKAGTYYIRVIRAKKGVSGAYSFKCSFK